jgi:hypothetical protein
MLTHAFLTEKESASSQLAVPGLVWVAAHKLHHVLEEIFKLGTEKNYEVNRVALDTVINVSGFFYK